MDAELIKVVPAATATLLAVGVSGGVGGVDSVAGRMSLAAPHIAHAHRRPSRGRHW